MQYVFRFRPPHRHLLWGPRRRLTLRSAPFQENGRPISLRKIARPGGEKFGPTAAADVGQDADLDFISGRQGGEVFWFENQGADKGTLHVIGQNAKTDVGDMTFDADGDG